MIRRGTTPVNVIRTDIDMEDAIDIRVTYMQGGKPVLKKGIDDVQVDEDTKTDLYIPLTQEETLSFAPNSMVSVQVRAKFEDGTAVSSNVMYTKIEDVQEDEVI